MACRSFPAYLCGIEEKDFVKNSIEYINKEKEYLKKTINIIWF